MQEVTLTWERNGQDEGPPVRVVAQIGDGGRITTFPSPRTRLEAELMARRRLGLKGRHLKFTHRGPAPMVVK